MTAGTAGRRAFLRGKSAATATVLRPPWAAADFTDRCTRCDDCLRHCAENILVRGDGGFPEVDFSRGQCVFCGDCVDSCRHGAFVTTDAVPWRLRARIEALCLSLQGIYCRTCGDSCEHRAIRFRLQTGGRAQPEIDDDLCTGCGACVAPCPAKAVVMKEAA